MPTVETPMFLTVHVPGTMTDPSLDITFSFDKASAKYLPASVKTENPMQPFTVTTMKKMPVHRLALPHLRRAIADANPELVKRPAVKSYVKGTSGRTVSAKAQTNPLEQNLTDAAAVYSMASVIRDFPIKAVQRCFGLDNTQARYWLKEARLRRILV